MTPWIKAISALIGYRPVPSAFDGKDIEYAFTSGKKDYYCFKGSGFGMYYERYAGAVDMIWACENHRITNQDFDIFLDTLDTYLNNGELVYAAQLVGNFRAIRQYCYSIPLLYNLASVWYFDKSESPYTLDQEYCEEKIRAWMKDSATLHFFLKSPIQKFIPSPNTLQENFQSFTRLSVETQLAIYERHLLNLSTIEQESDTIKNIRKQMENLKLSLNLAS